MSKAVVIVAVVASVAGTLFHIGKTPPLTFDEAITSLPSTGRRYARRRYRRMSNPFAPRSAAALGMAVAVVAGFFAVALKNPDQALVALLVCGFAGVTGWWGAVK